MADGGLAMSAVHPIEEQIALILERAAADIRALGTGSSANGLADLPHHIAHGDVLLDPDDLAAYLKLDARSVRRLRNAGEIPEPVMIGSAPRWRRTTIDQWLAEQEAE
jgi:predicted DNA-binding transcriptional regulator AlpA